MGERIGRGSLFWRHLGVMVLANILWLLLSLPIVTWPAATAGLFHLARRVIQEELEASDRDAISTIFGTDSGSMAFGAACFAIDLVGGGPDCRRARVLWGKSQEPLRWLVGPIVLIGLAWITAQLYVYPLLLQRPGSNPWEIIREALLMAIGYALSSLSLLVTFWSS